MADNRLQQDMPMEYQAGPFDKVAFAIGVLCAGAGLYFVLASTGLMPLPGGPSSVNGPIWLLTCVGLAFGFSGLAVIIRAMTGARDADGELPVGVSKWVRFIYLMMGPLILASLAAIGTWIACGPGERDITMSAPFYEGLSTEWIGRAMFGLGANVTWLAAALITRSVFRKLIGRETL
jgi:hypothetical protein